MRQSELRASASWLLRWPLWQARQSVPVSVWRRILPKSVLSFCYHMVSDTPLPHVKHYPYLNATGFEADIAWMRDRLGFVSYDQILLGRSSGNTPCRNAALPTFDDGFAQCADVVRAILERYQAPCVFFIITDLIDNRAAFHETKAALCVDAIVDAPAERIGRILEESRLAGMLPPAPKRAAFGPPASPADTAPVGEAHRDGRLRPLLHWLLTAATTELDLLDELCARLGVDARSYTSRLRPFLTSGQIRELSKAGFTIGAHSRRHRLLQTLPQTEAATEIVESCATIRALTGQKSVPFAFPHFGKGLDRVWLGEIRQRNDFVGLFFDTGALRSDAPFVVQRIPADRAVGAGSVDGLLRSAWARREAWHREG